MYCHDLEVMSSNPGWVEVGVLKYFCPKSYLIKNINCSLLLFADTILEVLEVNLFAFAYRLFRRDFSPLDGTYCNMSHRVGRNLYETVCRQMQTN